MSSTVLATPCGECKMGQALMLLMLALVFRPGAALATDVGGGIQAAWHPESPQEARIKHL
jgi:hypothetical protein